MYTLTQSPCIRGNSMVCQQIRVVIGETSSGTTFILSIFFYFGYLTVIGGKNQQKINLLKVE